MMGLKKGFCCLTGMISCAILNDDEVPFGFLHHPSQELGTRLPRSLWQTCSRQVGLGVESPLNALVEQSAGDHIGSPKDFVDFSLSCLSSVCRTGRHLLQQAGGLHFRLLSTQCPGVEISLLRLMG